MECFDLSVVILAKVHNPSILHDSFLKREDIVPEDWPDPEESVSTPPFARVRYTNGIVIVVELNKLQVVDHDPPESLIHSQAPGIAKKYVEVLPHVSYTALGLNLTGFTEYENASEFLIGRFLVSGPWKNDETSPESYALTLKYPLENVKLTFNIDAGVVQKPAQRERRGILLKANYHMDISPGNKERSGDQVAEEISNFVGYYDHFFKFSKILLGEEKPANELR